MKNTDRFTGKATSYVQGRPGYPDALFDLLEGEGFASPSRIADVGSGTGILSRSMLERGWTVYGVEPNDDMRHEAECSLKGFDRFHSIQGTAEHTSLPSGSVDAVTVAQAFHWFDAALFQRECRRILTEGGKTALIWNSRQESAPVVREEGAVHRRYCPRFSGFSGGLSHLDGRIREFFGNRFQVFRFPNELSYTREQYIRRMLSTSYALAESDGSFGLWMEGLGWVFDQFQKDGRIKVPNETVVYLGNC